MTQKNRDNKTDKQEMRMQKKEYSQPTLRKFGFVTEETHGGGGSLVDSGSQINWGDNGNGGNGG
ncbi:MAG: hypothetical protein L3J47_12285 [Sulfurovum sp.]|nr:hypothetical protein [Sulfurovum sp.]